MPISVDASVARWAGTPADDGSVTSGSFTPANDSLLVLCVEGDTALNTALTVTVSGGSLTWTLRARADEATVPAGNGGHASIWTAPVTTGASMTITVTKTGVGSTSRLSAKVYIVTGQHASPIGGSWVSTSTTNNYTPTATTMTGAGRLFGSACDWNALGLPTSTDTADAAHYTGAISVLSAHKSADHTSGSSQSINYDGFGTSAAEWNECRLEILAAASASFIPRLPYQVQQAVRRAAYY